METNPEFKRRQVKHNGKIVVICPQQDGEKFIEGLGERDICPLCKQHFRKGSTPTLILIVSNQVGIPNRMVHTECMEDKTDEYAFALIAGDFEESKRYADWFN